jgi:hypothetical protein
VVTSHACAPYRICWVTPALCKELSLPGFEELVRRVVRSVSVSNLKEKLQLGLGEGDISLQLASYVSLIVFSSVP